MRKYQFAAALLQCFSHVGVAIMHITAVFIAVVQAEKGYGGFLDELQRCEKLGLTRYNFHPGSTTGWLLSYLSIPQS